MTKFIVTYNNWPVRFTRLRSRKVWECTAEEDATTFDTPEAARQCARDFHISQFEVEPLNPVKTK